MRYPQTVTVQSPIAAGTTVAKSETFGSAVTVPCQITPMDAKSGFDRVGRDITNGYWLFCAVGLAQYFTVGAKVTFGSIILKVAAEPENFGAGVRTNHASVVLEAFRA